MLPFFELVVNEGDDITGVDFNSFVETPAHFKPLYAFNDDVEVYLFNEDKRIVTGVMISANQPIYRKNPERYVLFRPEIIKIIRTKNIKQGFANNVNLDHNENKVVKNIKVVSDYIINNTNQIPERFRGLNLQAGTWIRSYKINDPGVWNKVKKGEFGGFSVEVTCEETAIKLK